jgi:predicted NAD/FAD-dependent oxidoreductase
MDNPRPMHVSSCVVIGAGLSGLAAARKLSERGVRVTVLEKTEKVGGRMRTGAFDGGVFDEGAQFFTVRDARFEEIVNGWIRAGVAAEWTRGFADASGELQVDGYPRYMGTNGMAGIPEHLARNLKVETNSEATRIEATTRGWEVSTEKAVHPAEALVISTPAPLALALAQTASGSLLDEARERLESIRYNPCIAVLALLDGPGSVPQPGGVQIGGEPLFWVGDNRQKGISREPAITLHAGPGFSREHARSGDAEVVRPLLNEARDYLGSAEVRETAVYRWEHSWVSEPLDEPFVYVEGPPPLVFCGDAYGGPKVEGAVLSGLAAAERLLGAR